MQNTFDFIIIIARKIDDDRGTKEKKTVLYCKPAFGCFVFIFRLFLYSICSGWFRNDETGFSFFTLKFLRIRFRYYTSEKKCQNYGSFLENKNNKTYSTHLASASVEQWWNKNSRFQSSLLDSEFTNLIQCNKNDHLNVILCPISDTLYKIRSVKIKQIIATLCWIAIIIQYGHWYR